MDWYLRSPVEDSQDQTLLFTAQINGESKSLAARFVYRQKIDKWTVTVMDGTTMEQIVSNVPLVTTMDENSLNDVFRQFQHLDIGHLAVQGSYSDLALSDPYDGDLTAWTVLWGDT